jgi:hypothetical protein
MKLWGSSNLTMCLIKYYSHKKCDLPKKQNNKKISEKSWYVTEWWRSRHRFEGSRSSTNWAGYESTSKEVQGCTQRTHPRVMGSCKFVEAHWAWFTWVTKNRHLDSNSRRIRSRLRIDKKYFGSILEGSDCMAILGPTLFPFMLSFVSFYMTLGVQLFFPILASLFF